MKDRPKLKKFFSNIKPIIRGVVKSLPFGSVVIEVSDNIKTELALKKNETAKRIKVDENGIPKVPHSWGSIIFQLLCASLIVYAFVTKQITVEQVLNYAKYFTTDQQAIDVPLTDSIQ